MGDEIGRGGFGVVYKAQIEGAKRPLALKVLDPHPFNSDKAAARERFAREAKLLEELRHPSIISFIAAGEAGGKPYILMEYYPGLSFQKAREKHAPTPEGTLKSIEAVARGLAFAHSVNVVHRDLKPSNLMGLKKGDVRILDFGVAAIMDPEAERLTRTGGTIVGDAFTAPELSDNPRLLDPRCDIFSFGAVWFWLITGRGPKGANPKAVLRAATKIPPAFEAVVLRCIDSPENRYQSMDEVVRDLGHLIRGSQVLPAPTAMSDEMALILGIISQECSTKARAISEYSLEQEALPSMSKFRFAAAVRKLTALRLVEHRIDRDFDGEFHAFALTDAGAALVEREETRIGQLIDARPSTGSPSVPGDDVPF